jgi:hypothetical protein
LRLAGEVVSAEAGLASKTAVFSELFGHYFAGLKTDWLSLEQALQAARTISDFLAGADVMSIAREITLPKDPRRFAKQAQQVGSRLESQLGQQIESLLANFSPAEGSFEGAPAGQTIRLAEAPFNQIQSWGAALLESIDRIPAWEQYANAHRELVAVGLEAVVQEVMRKDGLALDRLPEIVRKRSLQLWLTAAYARFPAAGNFKASQHKQLIQAFRKLDQKLMENQKQKVLNTWQSDLPALIDSVPDSQAGILAHELQKKRAHLPLRRLFKKIPDLLFKLKPCILMSPLSVAAYLDLDQFRECFDLVIFDEASQVKPAYAIGAILRGKQVIVAGDTRQLPPTDFFHVTGDLEEFEEDDTTEEVDRPPESLESILGEFIGLPGVRQAYLRWHYRSRHESLIQFSNRRYYDHNLITFPGPYTGASQSAVRFVAAQGIYDRGKTRQNAGEAVRVVGLLSEHFAAHGPDFSLGVITLSIAQENAIREEIRHALEKKGSALAQFADLLNEDAAAEEPFFIKSLERVQGDERDTILLSVGYGPDAGGKISQNFGPINMEGGERRLNVAITRARQEMILVASLAAKDIRITENSKPGRKI